MIELARSYSLPYDDESLTWKPVKADGEKTAMLVCSNGHAGSIASHEIASDGTVTPSVVCPTDNCTFHEFVKLINWEGDSDD